MWPQQYWHTNMSIAILTTTKCHWLLLDVQSNFTKAMYNEAHGRNTLPTASTLGEHYRCHKVYVKRTRSERISDTVFFKHKYITQPTVMPADTIVKALVDLMHALKGRRNVKGEVQIEALERIDELLNNIPKQLEPERGQEQCNQVTFDDA
jgi:hypothetical protein